MSGRLILIADDDAYIRESIEILTRRSLACEVASVKDGDEAIDFLRRHKVEILIADMMMPGLQGLELVKSAREISPETDIIVMTAYTADFPYMQVVSAGATDIIGKPHAHEELQAKLMRVFQERETRHALIGAEKKYRSIFELNADGMAIVDARTLELLDANTAFCHLIAQERDRLVRQKISLLLPEGERERFESGLQLFARSGRGTLGDILFLSETNQEVFLDISVTFISLAAEDVVCLTFKDVTEKRLLEQRLTEVAQRDALTGLFNQRAYWLHLKMAVSAANRSEGRAFTLIALDVDNFKQCNDTHGHIAGDKVLQSLGKIILDSIRESMDEGFRCGGDEFCILLNKTDPHGAFIIADRVRKEYGSIENYGTSLSIGIAMYQGGMTAGQIAQAADQALYKAKAMGKNSCAVA